MRWRSVFSCRSFGNANTSGTTAPVEAVETCDERSLSFCSFKSRCGVLGGAVDVFGLDDTAVRAAVVAPFAEDLETRSPTAPTSDEFLFSFFLRLLLRVELKDKKRRRTHRGVLRLQLRGFLKILHFSLNSV